MYKFTIITLISIFTQVNCLNMLSYTRCNNDSNCKQPNSQCNHIYNYCECKNGYEMLLRNNSYYFCSTDKNYLDACTDDSECLNFLGTQSTCYNFKCLCTEGSHHVKEDGKCYKTSTISGHCYNDHNCPLNNGKFARCIQSRCKCATNQIPSKDLRACVDRKQLNEFCYMSEQCTSTTNAICRTTCQCDKGYVLSTNKTLCLEEAVQFRSKCVDINQCTKYLKGSICKNNLCVCPNGKHEKDGNCEENKELGEECTTTEACLHHKKMSGIVVCEKKVCKNLRSAHNSNTIDKFVLFLVFLLPNLNYNILN